MAGMAWEADSVALMDRNFCPFLSVAPHLMRGLAFLRSAARQYGPDGKRRLVHFIADQIEAGNLQWRDLWTEWFSEVAAKG